MKKIHIVHVMINGKKFNAHYCGRPKGGAVNPLQNNYTHISNKFTKAKYVVDTLEIAIESFDSEIKAKIKNKDESTLKAFKELKTKLDEDGVLYLSCWCKDEITSRKSDHACHCDSIREILFKYEEFFNE